jgi:hypothetical protein
MSGYFMRQIQMEDVCKRAERYYRDDPHFGVSSAVLSACCTMLFEPTEQERDEIVRRVRIRIK